MLTNTNLRNYLREIFSYPGDSLMSNIAKQQLVNADKETLNTAYFNLCRLTMQINKFIDGVEVKNEKLSLEELDEKLTQFLPLIDSIIWCRPKHIMRNIENFIDNLRNYFGDSFGTI